MATTSAVKERLSFSASLFILFVMSFGKAIVLEIVSTFVRFMLHSLTLFTLFVNVFYCFLLQFALS